jgi:hypothetical protein
MTTTKRMSRHAALGTCLMLTALCDRAVAQAPAADQPVPPAALSGPALSQSPAATIVEWRYDGTLRDLDVSPEEAALAKLTLDESSRARTNAVVARRQAYFDRVLSRNLMLAIEIDAANKAEEELRTARLTLDLLAHFEPLCDELPFRDQIAAVLGPEQSAQFLSMLREYDRSLSIDLAARTERQGGQPNTLEIYGGRIAVHFTKELERSFARMETTGAIGFEYVLAQLQLSPEQAERVRKAASPFLGASPEGMSEKEYGLAFLAMAAHLTEQQRAKFAEIIAGF